MKNGLISGMICTVTLLSLALPFSGQTKADEHVHEGFFFRFMAGAGSGSITIDEFSGGMDITGVVGAGRIQLGYTVAPNLIVYGEAGGASFTSPSLSIGGEDYDIPDEYNYMISTYGVGVTYYLMPSNIFFSLSVGATTDKIDMEDGDEGGDETVATTETGFAVFAAVGKEWWIGRNWSLGGAGFFEYGSTEDSSPGGPYPVTNITFGVMVSVTYN